ncbi:12397_t:CDS:2, partial [Cetraspora pellucida]
IGRSVQEQGQMDDEIRLFLDARYISASEASWRIFHYRLHNEKPDIMQLHVHLPGKHRVIFRDDEPLEDIINRSNTEKTTLTAWFEANAMYPEARRLAYTDFPTQWVYDKRTKKWKPRQKGAQLRYLFATLLIFCNPTRPEILWENHISALSDDIFFQVRHKTGDMTLELMDADIHNRALHHLQTILNRHGRQQQYDVEELTKLIENDLPRLNMDQRAVYINVIAAVEAEIPSVRLMGYIALAVASSGIAALLLPGGRTAHSRFKIPFDPQEGSTCSVSHGSDLALLLQQA